MLAYVFWHRPREGVAAEAYEQDHIAFHRSLSRTPPVGLRGSRSFRVAEIPWLRPGDVQTAGYEDWYLLDDFTALGVLNEAAVGHGHRTPHDRVARRYAVGAGAVYGLMEGEPALDRAAGPMCEATWVTRPVGSTQRPLGDLLGDGMDPLRASLWRRQLVLGPAPEFCVLANEPPPGVASTRLPAGWHALTLERELLFDD